MTVVSFEKKNLYSVDERMMIPKKSHKMCNSLLMYLKVRAIS